LSQYSGEQTLSDYFYDDPVKESKGARKNFRGVLALILLVVAGGTYLQTTLAANISLNSGGSVEFGQGIAMTAACSGANSLTVTPNSEFVNASGSGAHYLKTITVSGIPSECNGVDFQISAYDSTTSTALPIFGETKTVASIWNNGGSYQGGKGWLGSNVTSQTGAFTVSFTTPVALASTVARLTIQSTSHVAGDCRTESLCAVGDIGPGGGMVFYAGSRFTMTGATCNTNCNYLQWAPVSWASTQSQNASFNVPGTATTDARSGLMPLNLLVGTSTSFGSGLNNTSLMANAVGSGTSSTNAAKAVLLYAASDSSAGQWFLPSRDELIALYQSSVRSRGNFQALNLWSSSEGGANLNYQVSMEQGDVTLEARDIPKLFRPIRAF
jgi:hypothetical protein